MGKFILVTGGARSGKSKFAQDLAGKLSKTVLFVATAEALDDEMKARIEKHRKNRPETWRTLEAPVEIGMKVQEHAGKSHIIIIDCMTLLLNNIFNQGCREDKIDAKLIEKKLNAEIKDLLACIKKLDAIFIIVTNEVGMGIVPDNPQARLYRDLLGTMNQKLAAEAAEVYLLVAGLPVTVK
jgi:adenosylcobinamide kinase / adenosylcobinamide-phosphate guanylyltransferase